MQTNNVSDLAKRVNQICHDKGLNANELAKELGVTSTAIYKITSGDTKNPSMDLLTKFYQRLDVNMTWLATGEGSAYLGDSEAALNKPLDGGAFGEKVLNRVAEGVDELKGFFEEELRAKNQQIASLQRMLEMQLGKPKGSTRKRPVTNSNLQLGLHGIA